MSNWVVSGRRLSPSTMLGRKTVRGTSGEQLPHHVLAEFFRARVWIVVRAAPIDSANLPAPLRSLRCPATATVLTWLKRRKPCSSRARMRQLHHLQRAAQIHVEAAFFGFAIQRRGAVNHRIGGADQLVVFVVGKPKRASVRSPRKIRDAALQMSRETAENPGAAAASCHRRPRASSVIARAHQQVQRLGVIREQVRGDVGADVAGATRSGRWPWCSGVRASLPEVDPLLLRRSLRCGPQEARFAAGELPAGGPRSEDSTTCAAPECGR